MIWLNSFESSYSISIQFLRRLIIDEFKDRHIQFCIVDYTIQFYSHIDMIDAYIANRKVEHPFAVIVHSTKY